MIPGGMLPALDAPAGAIRPVTLLMSVVVLRWLAGIAEPYTVPGLSENVALAGLAVLGLVFLNGMRISHDGGMFVAGLALWIVAALFSAAANRQLGDGKAVQLVALLGFYALLTNGLCRHLHRAEDIVPIRAFAAAFLAAGASLAALQSATGQGFVAPGKPDLVRAFGSDVHPVSFGIQITIALAILEATRIKLGKPARLVHAALVSAGLAALYLTFARSAWGMAALTLAWASLAGRPGHVRLAGIAAGLGLAMLASANARFGDLTSLPTFLASLDLTNPVFDYRYVDNSLSWRVINWGLGLSQALENPIFGYGPGQSAVVSAFAREMHNIALELFFECGIGGLLALGLVTAGLVRLHRRLPRHDGRDRRVARLATGLGVSLILVVLVSTSLVDQLMTVVLYLLFIGVARVPAQQTA